MGSRYGNPTTKVDDPSLDWQRRMPTWNREVDCG
jgi:hypothetical protein